jgi:hypothetical protein
MRYSGGEQARMLECKDKEWIHGGRYGDAGRIEYGDLYLGHSEDPITDWVVACGRNNLTAGSAVTIINGVARWVTEVEIAKLQEAGNCELILNQNAPSDWQLSKLYVWNTHLPNDLFAQASSELIKFLNSAEYTEPPYDVPVTVPDSDWNYFFLGLFNTLIQDVKHLDNYYT